MNRPLEYPGTFGLPSGPSRSSSFSFSFAINGRCGETRASGSAMEWHGWRAVGRMQQDNVNREPAEVPKRR